MLRQNRAGELAEQLHSAGRIPEAEAAYRKALKTEPTNPTLANNLANLLTSTGRTEEAIPLYRRALLSEPRFAEALANLAAALMTRGDYKEAIAGFAQAIALRPDFYGFRQALGECWLKQGLPDLAARELETALAMNPADAGLHSSLLLTRCYDPVQTRASLAAAHRVWQERHAALLPAYPLGKIDRTPDRSLRLGFVSADLRQHPVAFFLEPLLGHRDRERFTCILYANQSRNDAFSERLNSRCDGWRSIFRVDDETVCRQIREDRIDILIDLSGHTGHHRLTLFARRPAPVQMTWLGYPGTTGLSAIDYRISDAIADPPDLDPAWSSEKVIHLDGGFLCFRPADTGPAPDNPSAAVRGQITFGSFNKLAKLSDAAIALWSKALHRITGSRLLIKAEALANQQVRERLLDRFMKCGIASDRLQLAGWTGSLAEHLATYRKVDIALDTFPYCGTTTTMESLWMGVPVVTLCGETHVSRVGASILTHAGCSQWIAHSERDFLDRVAELSADPSALADIRGRLRGQMENSPLMNAPDFCRRFEAACRASWETWCRNAPACD